ncbi:hypothetical protein RRG08_000313, partial [Elysia crispata]
LVYPNLAHNEQEVYTLAYPNLAHNEQEVYTLVYPNLAHNELEVYTLVYPNLAHNELEVYTLAYPNLAHNEQEVYTLVYPNLAHNEQEVYTLVYPNQAHNEQEHPPGTGFPQISARAGRQLQQALRPARGNVRASLFSGEAERVRQPAHRTARRHRLHGGHGGPEHGQQPDSDAARGGHRTQGSQVAGHVRQQTDQDGSTGEPEGHRDVSGCYSACQRNNITDLPDDNIHRYGSSSSSPNDFSGNQIRSIPSTINRIISLKDILAADNKIGAIEDSLGKHQLLRTLDLTNN